VSSTERRGGEAWAGLTPAPRTDATGRYVNVAPRSAATVGFYLVLVGILIYLNGVSSFSVPSFPALLAVILLVYLARYASTRYVMDSDTLIAGRLFGSRRVHLEQIRRVELANLRDLGPVGLLGTWGWRGRVWSPTIGTFDCIHTVSPGVLVSVGAVPMFLSPRDPMGFARELSRRARSWGVELEPDAPPVSARGRAGAN
jgi:hypothetical protein